MKKMKKGLACVLLLMSVLLSAGCQKKEVRTEPTDELVIYIPPLGDAFIGLSQAIEKFERKYTIKVTQVDLSKDWETYNERVINELNAEKGPDVLFPWELDKSSGGKMDLNKAMKNGTFLDLTPYMEKDEEFKKDNYFDGVFDAGQDQGKQYILPVVLENPLQYGSKDKFAELGMTLEKKMDVMSLLEEINQVLPAVSREQNFEHMTPFKNYFRTLYFYSGLRMINSHTNTVESENSELEKFIKSYKNYYQYEYRNPEAIGTAMGAGTLQYQNILEDRYYIINDSYSLDEMVANLSFLKAEGGYEVFALKNNKGGITAKYRYSVAINGNSKNSVNAYNFIKILMSENHQVLINWAATPIRKSAAYYALTKARNAWGKYHDEEGGYLATRLSDEEIAEIYDLLTRINTSGFIGEGDMVREGMEDYFTGEKSYGECYEALKEKLTLYISE